MLKVPLLLFLSLGLSPIVLAKYSKRIEYFNGGVSVFVNNKFGQSICRGVYTMSYNTTGWDVLQVETEPTMPDVEQAECAGMVEGLITYDAVYIQYVNVVKPWCQGRDETCRKVFLFLKQHLEWVKNQVKEKGQTDSLWHHVDLFYNQILGLHAGYSRMQKDPKKKLTIIDIMLMNFVSDLDDVAAAITGDTSAKVRGETRCSAIIKLLPNNADLLVGHTTWTDYTQMYRMLKSYDMPLNTTGSSGKPVPGKRIVFSGYPGVITSGDDFYITSSNLVAQETTIGNSNASLWQYINPIGQLFEPVRSLVAMRLADNGSSWCRIFSGYNSGTYNNQWMIVDLKRFIKGRVPTNGTLWILEQIPGHVHYEDQTPVLTSQSYWASYNTPYYKDIFNMSGNQELVNKYGDWFSYTNTPRARIFRRDHSFVTDVNSLMKLMRSNNYTQDPYAACNCTPPYSAENAIAARCDLNPTNGKYPFSALGHRPHGAIDAKVVSCEMALNMTFMAVCGPTSGAGLPTFSWDKVDFNHLPHMGQPNSFDKFSPILTPW